MVLGVAIRMVTPHVKGNIQVVTHQVVAFRRVDHQVEVLLQGGTIHMLVVSRRGIGQQVSDQWFSMMNHWCIRQ